MPFSTASITVRDVLTDVRAVYQPIVDLREGVPVGFEALARGPEGSGLERPDRLFAAARREGVLAELDWTCRAAAFRGALEAGLGGRGRLFVNIEADVADSACPAEHAATVEAAGHGLRVIYEITERELAQRPAELLRMVEGVRAVGWGIALDDVGADWRSLALMPLLRPDVVKLDMRLIQGPPSSDTAIVSEAVRAYAERSGACVVAEGIETEEHRLRALALGASLGQGWMFGRPEELSWKAASSVYGAEIVRGRPAPGAETPFAVAEHAGPVEVARKQDLLAMSRGLERRALAMTEPCVVLAAFQTAERFTPATAHVYELLARRSSFVGAFGVDLPPEPAPGVRGALLPDNHRLAGEWDVVVLAPHYAGALIARDLGDAGDDMQRRFGFVLTHDPTLVADAARTLMARMVAFS